MELKVEVSEGDIGHLSSNSSRKEKDFIEWDQKKKEAVRERPEHLSRGSMNRTRAVARKAKKRNDVERYGEGKVGGRR